MNLKREATIKVKIKIRVHKIFIQIFWLSLVSILLIAICSPVSARSRRTFLTDFILNNKVDNLGYSNSMLDNETVYPESTYYALFMLEELNLLENQEELDVLATNLALKVTTEIEDLGDNSLTNLYYLLFSLELLEGLDELSSEDKNIIIDWIDITKNENGGYGNDINLPTVFHTFFSVKILSLLSSENNSNVQKHVDWILSCYNTDGGFGGNEISESGIISTYYAVSSIDFLTNISDLSSQNESIIEYVLGFYNSDSYDPQNYGGFSQLIDVSKTQISTTYYCVSTVNYLETTQLDSQAILNWVLQFQNPIDGGFSEFKSDEATSYSSMITTYYAFNIIKYLDPTFSSLIENVWDVEFNPIILIIIIAVVITVPTVVVIIIWRKRKL